MKAHVITNIYLFHKSWMIFFFILKMFILCNNEFDLSAIHCLSFNFNKKQDLDKFYISF